MVRLLFVSEPNSDGKSKYDAGEQKMRDLEMIERYKKIRVADVVDALDRYGYHDRVLVSNEIKPLYSGIMMAGQAVTVKANRVQEEVPSMTPEEYDRYAREWYSERANYDHFMKHAGPGVVLVVNVDGYYDVGFWGSMVGLSAKAKGVEGIVIDGGCRDTYEMRKIQFPVFCRAVGRTEVIGRIEIKPENVNVPITVGDAYVNPRDIVVGDDDGVAIVPKNVALQVLERAEKQLDLDRKSQKPFLDKVGIAL
jgi:regulator of RNase E activity RraA